jgi:hypothetical protein
VQIRPLLFLWLKVFIFEPMARITKPPKEEHVNYLKNLIYMQFSKEVLTTYDCKLLTESIKEKINETLSSDTLRRFFGVIQTVSLPSLYTLDVLSKFVGCKNWVGLIASYETQNKLYQKSLLYDVVEENVSNEELFSKLQDFTKSEELFALFNQILLVKVKQKDSDFLKNIFALKSLFDFEEYYKYEIYHTVHLVGALCLKHDWLKTIAIENFFNLPYEEDYFVEWLVLPQQDYYSKILNRYFELNKNCNSKMIFYHLIQCTKFAKVNNWQDFSFHFKELQFFKKDIWSINNILLMRWYGVHLLHLKEFNNEIEMLLVVKEILKCEAVNNPDAGDRVSSIFIISSYLVDVDLYEIVVNLYQNNASKYSNILGYWAALNYNHLKVFYAFSLSQINQLEKGKLVFSEIDPNKFDMNFKEELSVIYQKMKILYDH